VTHDERHVPSRQDDEALGRRGPRFDIPPGVAPALEVVPQAADEASQWTLGRHLGRHLGARRVRGTRQIHAHLAPVDPPPIHRGHGRLSQAQVGERDETETAAVPAVHVDDDARRWSRASTASPLGRDPVSDGV